MLEYLLLFLSIDTVIAGYDVIIGNIPSGQRGPKTVTVSVANLQCPAQVDRMNWLGTDTYSSIFRITVNQYEVTATRLDTGDQSERWGQDLRFSCYAMEGAQHENNLSEISRQLACQSLRS